MKRFIMTERNGIYIIDLQQSLAYIDRSYAFIKETVAKGGTVMFVGTKKQAQEAIAEQATRVGMPYVNQRWLGGMLTNFQTVHQRINRLKELDEIDFDDVAGSSRTKKELLQMRRERDKLNKSLGGIREMGRTPAAVWIVDTNKEHLAVEEARKLRIPIVGILDSNCDPDVVDFPIPGNDDAIRAVGLLTRVVADAVAEGLIARSGAKSEGEATPGAEEPLAEWERELLEGDAAQAATAATGGDATTDTPAEESTGAAATGAEAADAAEATDEGNDEAGATTEQSAETESTTEQSAETESTTEQSAETEATTEQSAETEATESADAPKAFAAVDGEQGEFGPDSAPANEDGSAPEGFEIKGNKDSMKFHAPSSPWYSRTNAEVWFRTAEAAEAAGFVDAEQKS
jgi:small subunit ribosomal protein S2